MRLLAYFFSVALTAISAAGALAQQLPTGSGHALMVYSYCQQADLNPFKAIRNFEKSGWIDNTEETAFRRAVAESLNIKARAFLSESSYPDSFDASRAKSPEEVSSNVRKAVQNAVFERRGTFEGNEPARLVFLLKSPNHDALATVDFFRGSEYSHLICETTTKSGSNPELTDLLLADRERARSQGSTFERWRTKGPEVNYAYSLSEHAQQKDSRFDAQFDLVLRGGFYERSSK
jgi:hypothetical protein